MQENSLTYYLLSNDTIGACEKEEELYFDKYFSRKHSPETPFFPIDSTIITTSQLRYEPEYISKRPETLNWFFGVFLIAFVIFSHVIGKNIKMSFSVITDSFTAKARKGFFAEYTKNEWYSRLYLCIQTCLLIAVFLCKYFDERLNSLLNFPMKSLIFLLSFTFILCVFFLVKFAMYRFVAAVFFDRESFRNWKDNYLSLFAYLGILLFVPVLLYLFDVFGNVFGTFWFVIILSCFVVFEISIIVKTILLFFYKQNLLLYLFLYLCAQEIIPLFFLWKFMDVMFNLVEKNALWI